MYKPSDLSYNHLKCSPPLTNVPHPSPPNPTEPKYAVSPRISLKARILNILLSPLAYFQVSPVFKPLKLSSLEKQASQGVRGLKDFGDECYKGPYEETMDMVNKGGYR